MDWRDGSADKDVEAMSNSVSSNPRRHMMEEKNPLLQINSWTPHVCRGACVHSTHIDEVNK